MALVYLANKDTLVKAVEITSISSSDLTYSATTNLYTYTANSIDYTFVKPANGVAPAVGDYVCVSDTGGYEGQLITAAAASATFYEVPSFVDITALTDSSGGTASDTLAAITITTPADLAAVGVQLGIIRNAVASLAAKVNAVIAG